LEGKDLTAEQKEEIEARRQKLAGLVKQMLSWESMEQMYLKVYGETFTQQEIDGMTAFYSSPTGHAVVAKLPLAMKNSMLHMQQRMQSMIPQIQQLAKEAADGVKAQDAAKKKAG